MQCVRLRHLSDFLLAQHRIDTRANRFAIWGTCSGLVGLGSSGLVGSGGGGLSKLSTGGGGGATSTLDRVFFSYMGKLFADLVDLKLRARRRVSGKDAGTGAASVQSAQEVSTSSGSDSSGHGDSGDGEAEEAGGFYIGE